MRNLDDIVMLAARMMALALAMGIAATLVAGAIMWEAVRG